MSHIVMDFSCDSISFFQCCIIDFIVLFFQESVIFFGKQKVKLFAVISAVAEIKCQLFLFFCISLQKNSQQNSEKSGIQTDIRKCPYTGRNGYKGYKQVKINSGSP